MQVHSISNANSFQGKFEINPLFEKFRSELNLVQKDKFEKQIKRIEQTNDGRIFKFDRVANNDYSDETEVGIFEKVTLIDRTMWMPLFCTTREKAVRCFKDLSRLYEDIQRTKSDVYKN